MTEEREERREAYSRALKARTEYIEALPEGKRQRIAELLRRGSSLNTILLTIEDHPAPNAHVQAEMVEFLRQECEEARSLRRYTERAYGVPELPPL